MEYVKLENGEDEVIYFEITPTKLNKEQKVALRQNADSDYTYNMEDFLNPIASFIHNIGEKLSDCKPSEVEVEFGLNVDVNSGGVLKVIVSSSISASMKVKLTWKEDKEKNDGN